MKLDAIDQKVTDDIARVGWSAISVFPDKEDGTVPFTYTVGLAEYDHPDLIVLGMNSRQAHGCLTAAVGHIQGGTRYSSGSYATEVIQRLRVAFLTVSDPLDDLYPMSMTHHLYGEVRGLQLVWPDARDRFPWDADFDERYTEWQPLLGPWEGP